MERRLGRGLGSLLGAAPQPITSVEGPGQEIALDRIIPNPKQPRKVFDIAHMEELVASIQRHGVLQPIVVRPVGDKFELVSGERRTRASQIAGKTTIPAVVRTERGSVRATLHAARLDSVRDALARAGIAPDRVLLDEAGPGGSGSTSSEALRVLDAARREPMRLPTSGILSTATTGGTQ
jgi:hypothetical protein